MLFYTCLDLFKKFRLFVNERNRKIDVIFKVSRAIVIRLFSLNEAPLGLFKFISDYLPYFEKINIFFNIIYKDWSKLFLFGSFKITSIRLYTPLHNPLHGLHSVYNLIEAISSWTKQKLQSILKYFLWENLTFLHKIEDFMNIPVHYQFYFKD